MYKKFTELLPVSGSDLRELSRERLVDYLTAIVGDRDVPESYSDARGMGVRNKIIPLMRAQNGVDPEFEATEDYLRLTLRRGSTHQL